MVQNNFQGAMQSPVQSGFNAQSTTADVIQGIDLTGKIAIVTGGNSGIGLETTKTLAAAGARVIVLSKNAIESQSAFTEFPNVEIEEMDLMNPESIAAFADAFLQSGRPLHILINNAGVMWVPLRRDSRGFESQLAINYLGHFQLTALLFPALMKVHGARVVNVASQGHHFAPFDFEDPNFTQREYETLLGYGQSKTASILFSMLLADKAKACNVNVYSVHPGSVGGTNLAREASIEMFQQMGFCDAEGQILPEVAASLKTVPQGAATSVWCATNPILNDISGVYCEDVNVATLATEESKFMYGVMPYALVKTDAELLWEMSEKMTHTQFQIKELVSH